MRPKEASKQKGNNMPSETFHTTHQGPRPGEQVTDSGIILPAGVDRQKNVRETISFDNLGTRSTKYNTPGVSPEDPYNAFASEADSKAVSGSEASNGDLLGEKTLADKQPRRVRTENGVIQKLVKYNDGTYDWVGPDGKVYEAPAQDESIDEALSEAVVGVEAERGEVDLHSEILEQVTGNLEEIESKNEKQDEAIEQLRKQYEEIARKFDALSARMEKTGFGAPEGEFQPKYPGKELEPYVSKEVELYQKDGKEVARIEEEPDFEIAIPPELVESLQEAQDKYASLTAKHRGSVWGHYLHNSKWLAKIPGLKRGANWINERADAELNDARDGYKQAVRSIQVEITDRFIEEYGAEDDEAKLAARLRSGDIAIQSEVQLELKIAAERMQRSGATNSFVDWWVRQEGLGGKLKKAGIIAGTGALFGLVASLGGVPLLGVAAGAGVGGGIGAWVNKKRASGITEKHGVNTLAEKQGVDDIAFKSQYVKEQQENGQDTDIDELSNITEWRTGAEKAGNRARIKSTAGAGALGASLGAAAGGAIRNGISHMTSQSNEHSGQPHDHPKPPEVQQQPKTPEIQGNSFNVEPGNGYTNELVQFAQANGHALNPDQSWQLHQALVDRFGSDYIDIANHAQDVYQMGPGHYDIGLSAPGQANWDPGVANFIKSWMGSKGLW